MTMTATSTRSIGRCPLPCLFGRMTPFLLAFSSIALMQSWQGGFSRIGTVCAFQPSVPIKSRQLLQLQQRSSIGGVDSTNALYSNSNDDDRSDAAIATAEAERLLAKAKAIRESLPESTTTATSVTNNAVQGNRRRSEFSLLTSSSSSSLGNAYRLYLDIGREPGTWMDPRWGGSGRRIECTLDVCFSKPEVDEEDTTITTTTPSEEITTGLIKTVTNKSSSLSPISKLQFAPYARLRGGFDKMTINDGGYCIESSATASLSSSSTLRFCIDVKGTTDMDVSIPEGALYFALPFFGMEKAMDEESAPKMALSQKEGTITVKQMGWHTGWYREESRILGVFRAVPLEKAQGRDKF